MTQKPQLSYCKDGLLVISSKYSKIKSEFVYTSKHIVISKPHGHLLLSTMPTSFILIN